MQPARKDQSNNDTEQNQNNQNKADQQLETQFDVNGSDLLFDMAQKIQEQIQQQEKKQKEQQKQHQPEETNKDFKQVDAPKMDDTQPKQKEAAPESRPQEDEAMEYQHDED